jgi:hypothetical protein
MFEYCVQEFVQGVLRVLGIEDSVTFVRSKMANRSEEINALLSASEYLSQEYITEKLLTILGDIDKVDEVMKQMADDSISRMSSGEDEPEDEPEEEKGVMNE